jgi:hypothetical protein
MMFSSIKFIFEYTDEDDDDFCIKLLGAMREHFREELCETKEEPDFTELKKWLKINLGDPYPSAAQINKFQRTTCLTKIQINNWFSNARRRWPELKNNAYCKRRRISPFNNNYVFVKPRPVKRRKKINK